MNLVAVFVENKPGQSARVTRILAEAKVNICWVTITSNGTFGVMKFLVEQPDLALERLRKDGLMVSFLEVLAVEVPNEPGSLQKVAEVLGENRINLDNCSGFVVNNRAILVIEVQQLAEAHRALQQQGLRLLSQEEMIALRIKD
jgi:hypothetical protein